MAIANFRPKGEEEMDLIDEQSKKF